MKRLWQNIKFYYYETKFECGGGYKVFVKDAIIPYKLRFGTFYDLDNNYTDWLEENTKGRFCYERMPIFLSKDITITFAQKSEAMHFKLVWGGN